MRCNILRGLVTRDKKSRVKLIIKSAVSHSQLSIGRPLASPLSSGLPKRLWVSWECNATYNLRLPTSLPRFHLYYSIINSTSRKSAAACSESAHYNYCNPYLRCPLVCRVQSNLIISHFQALTPTPLWAR